MSSVVGRETRLASRLALAAALSVTVGCGTGEPTYRPDIVLVLADTVRGDSLGVAGYAQPTTPAIDALAAEGAYFANAYSHSTWTKPSIATLFTSNYTSRHGIGRQRLGEDAAVSGVLSADWPTLAEALSAAGYQTAAVVNQFHIQEKFGFAQGFEHFFWSRGHSAFRINRRFDRWLRQADERPLFAYLHYLDCHWPYSRGRKKFGDRFGSVGLDPAPPTSDSEADAWARDLDATDLAALRARYDREVAFVDAAVRDLVAVLEARSRWRDTVLVVTSDHGEGFKEHDRLLHGFAPYREVVHVPLVIRLPERMGLRRGVIERPVGLIDLMPTLLDLADTPTPSTVVGTSLRPLLEAPDEAPSSEIVIAEDTAALSARDQRYTLLRFADGRTAFFDRQVDPSEVQPLEGPCRGRCAVLSGALDRHVERAQQAIGEGDSVSLSAEEIALLRSLGYL